MGCLGGVDRRPLRGSAHLNTHCLALGKQDLSASLLLPLSLYLALPFLLPLPLAVSLPSVSPSPSPSPSPSLSLPLPLPLSQSPSISLSLPPSLSNADSIVVVNKGTIAEVGTHDELLAQARGLLAHADTRAPRTHQTLGRVQLPPTKDNRARKEAQGCTCAPCRVPCSQRVTIACNMLSATRATNH